MTTAAYNLLTKGQEVIRNPDHWTQRFYARNKDGVDVSVGDPTAVCYCSYGALLLPTDRNEGFDDALEFLTAAVRIVTGTETSNNIVQFNDSHTHDEVMAVWDKARELAQA